MGGKGLWRSPASWECPQQALINRLMLMKFLKCIYLHSHHPPALPCVSTATFGNSPVEYSLWGREFWLQKSRVRSGTGSSVPCPDSAAPILQWLSCKEIKCCKRGNDSFSGNWGEAELDSCSGNIQNNNSGIECSAEPSKGNFHPFPFFWSSSLWVWQLGLVIPWLINPWRIFFFLSEAKRGQISSSSCEGLLCTGNCWVQFHPEVWNANTDFKFF